MQSKSPRAGTGLQGPHPSNSVRNPHGTYYRVKLDTLSLAKETRPLVRSPQIRDSVTLSSVDCCCYYELGKSENKLMPSQSSQTQTIWAKISISGQSFTQRAGGRLLNNPAKCVLVEKRSCRVNLVTFGDVSILKPVRNSERYVQRVTLILCVNISRGGMKRSVPSPSPNSSSKKRHCVFNVPYSA